MNDSPTFLEERAFFQHFSNIRKTDATLPITISEVQGEGWLASFTYVTKDQDIHIAMSKQRGGIRYFKDLNKLCQLCRFYKVRKLTVML